MRPADEAELVEAVAGLVTEKTPAVVKGAGTKRGFGRPVNAAVTLDLQGLDGIQNYEPDELTLTCGVGTSMAEISKALRQAEQELAFEPPDFGPLYGAAPGGATIGGVIACNLSGSRRVRAGTARDHFLGFRAVSGRGERFKAGGHVVKNVSGYDLCKLLAGSFGTLAAMSEVTVKVLPRSKHTHTLLFAGLDPISASATLVRASQTQLEVSGLACIPEGLLGLQPLSGSGTIAAIRIEGPGKSVAERASRMRDEIGGECAEIAGEESADLWKGITDAKPFAKVGDAEPSTPLWRISVPPARAGTTVIAITERIPGQWLVDGGGVIWFALREGTSSRADEIRAQTSKVGGHATLVRASDAERAAVGAFPRQSPGLARISSRIREGFDPGGILNPGRMATA